MPHRQYSKADPRRYYTRLKHSLGRRGVVLALLGVTWILQGVGTVAAPPNPRYYLLDSFDIFRTTAWVVTGAIALYYARRPQGFDIPGFVALYFMCAFRTVAYGAAFVAWLLPGGVEGDARGIVGVFSWATIIFLLVVVSGWTEADDMEVRE